MANNQDSQSQPTPATKKSALKKALTLGLTPRELAGAGAGEAAAAADEITTEKNFGKGYGEEDPIARPFTHLPEKEYMALGAAATLGLAEVAHQMKQSSQPLIRHIGKIIEPIQIEANATNAVRNSELPDLNKSRRPADGPHAENELLPALRGLISPGAGPGLRIVPEVENASIIAQNPDLRIVEDTEA